MAIEVLAGSVIAHRRPRVCVAGRDLHVPQVHSRVEHGRDERMPSLRTRRVRRYPCRNWPALLGG